MTAASGSPLARPLPDEDHVGLDALVLDGPHAAGAPDAALHLVGDEHDAVRGAEVAQLAEPARGRDDVAALALDRLDDDRGDVARVARGA